MFIPIYTIITIFAVGSIVFALLGARMNRRTPVQPVHPVPAQSAQLRKAA